MTKIHPRTKGLGLPVAVVLTGGEVSDVKGYGADGILGDLEVRGVTAVIPPKRNRKVQLIIGRHPCAPRNLVER